MASNNRKVTLIRRIYLVLFAMLFALPIATINTEADAVSPIDNRALAPVPWEAADGTNFSSAVENYLDDRIGFRNEAILDFSVTNSMLFGKLVHPSYEYGEDGYVYFANRDGGGTELNDYQRLFAQTVAKLQAYAESRDLPFIFVFEPIKNSVMDDHLPEGVNYERGWVDKFIEELDRLGVRYVDLTPVLEERYEAGEMVFNKVYNAGHWNDLGAFYGINAVLEELKKDFPQLHINAKEEFTEKQVPQKTLMVSEFPINDTDTVFDPKYEPTYAPERYPNVEVDPRYRTFYYYENQQRQAESEQPRTLVFQGSYTNGMGYKFLANALPEYFGIHNYQNVLNMDYYVDLFEPDAIIFEVAEYTLSDTYFSTEAMQELDLGPAS